MGTFADQWWDGQAGSRASYLNAQARAGQDQAVVGQPHPGRAGGLSCSWLFDHCHLDGVALDAYSPAPGRAHSEVYGHQGTCGSIRSSLGLGSRQAMMGRGRVRTQGTAGRLRGFVLCSGDSLSGNCLPPRPTASPGLGHGREGGCSQVRLARHSVTSW